MPPRRSTRGCHVAYPGPSTARGDATPPTGVAQALNRMAEVMEHVTGNTRRVEPESANDEDLALERFLKFYPP
jgi:hypothetical protein